MRTDTLSSAQTRSLASQWKFTLHAGFLRAPSNTLTVRILYYCNYYTGLQQFQGPNSGMCVRISPPGIDTITRVS